jgi:hypothetical protein
MMRRRQWWFVFSIDALHKKTRPNQLSHHPQSHTTDLASSASQYYPNLVIHNRTPSAGRALLRRRRLFRARHEEARTHTARCLLNAAQPPLQPE